MTHKLGDVGAGTGAGSSHPKKFGCGRSICYYYYYHLQNVQFNNTYKTWDNNTYKYKYNLQNVQLTSNRITNK